MLPQADVRRLVSASAADPTSLMNPSVARILPECETASTPRPDRLIALTSALASALGRLSSLAPLLLLTACGARPAPLPVKPTVAPTATPAPVVTRQPAPPAVVATDTSVGTPHPVVLEAASADGRWAVLCQAREDTNGDGRVSVTLGARGELLGDKMRSYFVEGAGAGVPIDEFVGSDGSRLVATIREGRLVVADTLERRTIDLTARGADVRADAANYLPHRSIAFDTAGRLLYLRRDADRTRAVVLDPKTGLETVIDPGNGAVWRAELLASGAVLYVVSGDTNGNGRLDFPVPDAGAGNWRCRGPIPHFDAWQGRGDAIEVRVALSGAANATPVPGFVALLGTELVVREPSGRLVLQRRSSPSEALVTLAELASAKCGARILGGDEARRLLLIACTKAPGRAPVELVGEGYRNDLKVSVEARTNDALPRSPQRLFAFYPGAQALLVDFETRRTTLLESGETVIAVDGSRALTRRGNGLWVRDVVTGSVTALVGQLSDLGDVLHQPPMTYVTPLIADLSNSEIIGAVSNGTRPLALSKDGRALLPAQSADATKLATGPLLWTTRR